MLGGIGAGKSHVARRIATRTGARVLDADRLAQGALEAAAQDGRLAEALGAGAVASDGGPDRQAIARLVFDDEAARRRLEALVHPPVLRAIRDAVEAHRRGEGPSLLVLDVPLLLETGLDRLCDVLWFVEVSPETRQRRASERGLAPEAWQRREAAQISTEHKRLRADVVLPNDARLDARLEPLLRDLGVLAERTPRRDGPRDPTV